MWFVKTLFVQRRSQIPVLRFKVSDYFSPAMPQFTYRARNAQGGLVEGVLDCADRAVAIRQIESQHCIPIRIDLVEAAKPAEAKATAPPPTTQRKLRLLGSPEVATPSQSLKIPHGQLLI